MKVVKIITWVVFLAMAGWMTYVFAGPNRHSVIAGEIYRSGQPSGKQLASEIKKKQIQTVMNLRGFCPDFDWYKDEMNAVAAANTNLEDVTMSAKCLPSPGEIRRMVDIFDHSPRPILIHCKEGKDRTGLAAAVALLLYTDATVATAKRELWPVWGHFQVGRTIAMDDFFVRYETWLANTDASHTPDVFRDWLLNHYVAGVGRSRIEWVTPMPTVVAIHSAPAYRVRVTNRSHDPWRFKSGSTAGVHLGYMLKRTEPDGTVKMIDEDKAGLFQKTIMPGESIELMVTLPKLTVAGPYHLHLEMLDFDGAGIGDRATPFTKLGDEPVDVVFDVK